METVVGAVGRVLFTPGGGDMLVILDGSGTVHGLPDGCKLVAGGSVMARHFVLLWLLRNANVRAELTLDPEKYERVVKAVFTAGE